MDSLELIGTESIHFIYEWIEKFRCSFFQSLISVQMESKSTKRHRLYLSGCIVFSSNVRHVIVPFLSRGSVKIASLHPIDMSLSKAANTVKFLHLKNLHLVFVLYLLHDSMTSVLLRIYLGFAKSSWVHTSLEQSREHCFREPNRV